MLGPAPIVDFDGTLARLDIQWGALRERLGVRIIRDLWNEATTGAWATVSAAEVAAAARAVAVEPVRRALSETVCFAVLTNNAEDAVRTFVTRFPDLEQRIEAVVGRETLNGPKDEFTVFERGFAWCVSATTSARGTEPVVYVGDLEYELEFARRLGARALHVDDLRG